MPIIVSLNKQSLQKASKKLKQFGKNLKSNIEIDIEKVTKKLYDKIIENCKDNNITIHDSNIYWEYDKNTNIGKVWTDDIVIQFNEFGTGIMGTQDSWANTFNYKVNQSGKGDEGWFFENKDHLYKGITHGIESKHMFYNALSEMQLELPKTISITIKRLIGDMY